MVRIVQCMCQARHCIMGFAYEPGRTEVPGAPDVPPLNEATAATYLKCLIQYLIGAGKLDPYCGFCKSKVFSYSDEPSIFETIEEAYPVLKRAEAEQRAAREFYDASRN